MDPAGLVVIGIFVVTLLIIMTEQVNDTAASLLGFAAAATVVYASGGADFGALAKSMDWSVIMFVVAMMVIVSVVASSGLFQYLALIIAVRTAGNPRRIFDSFMVLVFVISLFFDPLPTMLIVSTFTVEVCNAIDVDFRPYLMTEAVIAGIGSFPTPIGSVSNLVVVYLADINAGIMFLLLLPLAVLLTLFTVMYMRRKYSEVISDQKERDITDLLGVNPLSMVRSKSDFIASCIAMSILILGLIVAPEQASMLALLLASGLLLTSGNRAKDFLRTLSWDSIFFLVGMFGIVQALDATGVIADLGAALVGLSEANYVVAILVMIWVPGGLMAPIDAKAVGILVAPAVKELTAINPVIPISLVAGTNMGGYVVPFGDAPNTVVVSIAEKHCKPLSWSEFNRAVIPIGLFHLAVSTVYLSLTALLFP
ncbi:MAG: hypothetical protein HXY34_03565 [Candidatus Thorarchaeota archaeon]|nr:hypothetical protein [Candidatus Thorarchaeota archaeon]